MRRPQSVERVSLKTLLVMLVFLKVAKGVLGCTNCPFQKNILTSEIIISGASNCTVTSSEALQNTSKGNDLHVSELKPGTSYNITLNCSSECCIQFTTKPDVIRNLSVTHITTATVSLNWSAPEGRSLFYRVEWDDMTVPKITSQTSVEITGLIAGVQYVFRVVAVAADNQTAGDSVSKTQYTKPDVITNLIFSQITTSSVSLSWTAPQGNSSFYRVEWNDSIVSINKMSVVITGLTAGVQYVFRVFAVAADNQTAGDSVSKTQYTRPKKVVIRLEQTGNSSLGIAWDQQGQGSATTYDVHLTNSDLQIQQNQSTTAVKAKFSQLSPGIIYNVAVTSVAGSFNTTSNTFHFATKPNPPQSINTSQTNNSISITWETPLHMDGVTEISYNIGYQSHIDWVYTSVSENRVTLSLLSPRTEYNITLKTVGPQNLTSTSVNLSVYTAPNPVTGLKVIPQSSSSVMLKWQPPSGDQQLYSYKIHVSNSSGLGKDYTGNTTSIHISGLQPGTMYRFSVTPVIEENIHGGPEITSGYTRPLPVSQLQGTKITTSSILLIWEQPEPKEGYTYHVTVAYSNGTLNNNQTVNDTTVCLELLQSGYNHTFTVTTLAADGTKADPRSISLFTRPDPIEGLKAVTKNTTTVYLNWTRPRENQLGYSYRVETIGCTSAPKNQSENRESAYVTDLRSGSNCTFKVYSQVGKDTEGEPVSTSQYTRPLPVSQLQGAKITTSSILLIWEQPEPKEGYTYHVTVASFNGTLNNNQTVNNTTVCLELLQSGYNHTFTITTLAVDGTKADPRSISLFTRPDPIEGLKAVTKNTTTVYLNWTRPREDQLGYSYRVETIGCTSAPKNQSENRESAYVTDLRSGSNCTFKVYSQVGKDTEGEPVSTSQYTRPDPIEGLKAVTKNSTTVYLNWTRPRENQLGYSYRVETIGCTSAPKNQSENRESAYVTDLRSGSNCTFKVYSQVGKDTEGEPVSTSQYTRPLPVSQLQGTKITTSSILLIWEQPEPKEGYTYHVTVAYSNGTLNNNQTVNDTTVCLELLQSGYNHTFTVTTLAADGTKADPRSISLFTRPDPIVGLKAVTKNTTTVYLNWTRPREDQLGYSYRVESIGCTSAPKNQSENRESAYVTDLRSGSNCTFKVYSQVGKDTEGEPVSTSQYTKPEKLTPTVSPGGNDSIIVSWQTPKGTVEKYEVNLSSSDGENSTQELNSTVRSYEFSGLMAAKVYSVKLSTISGPFTEESEPVLNATYPNQPGPIKLREKTTNFIFLEWGKAPGEGSFNYSVFYQPAANVTITQRNTVNLSDLASGTAYNISVSTVGPLGFTSLPVRIHVMTRPESVRSLEVTSTSEEEITVQWEATAHRYRVAIGNDTEETHLTQYRVRNLTPGTQYTISVTTLAFDETVGIQKSVTNCTDAAPVTDLSCEGPNRTDAVLVLSWSKPRGVNQGFEVQQRDSNHLVLCNSSCSHNLTHLLTYNTEYSVMVRTLGCGEKSVATKKVCKTGITDPPAPRTENVSIIGKEHDRFTLQLSPTLFNETHGPIVNYGVLVTSDPQSRSGENNSLLKTYLDKTYKEWEGGITTTYLAIIKDSERRQRNSGKVLVVVMGDGTKFHLYNNGPLSAFQTYSFAVVAFTYLDINKGLVSVEKSFYSISKFYPEKIRLPLNPVFLGGAVGGALAALLILTLATVIAAVCWKKLSKGKSSDVPIYSMRAKVSVPVKVENYEAYYRQHQADSNCGFAEQFENLKLVGVAQAKSCAEIPENKGKNRYNNVLPYDSSRVKLSVLGTQHDDYINANYMPGYNSRKEFIAAQGPLPSTLNEFWRMIWEKNVHTVVMLTRCNESGKVKCEKYWPSESQHYGNIAVSTASDIPLEDWTIRDFSAKNLKTAETRSIRQFHFTAWPDHGVPETTELLINFRHLVREHMDQYSRYSPTVVHCSAGVGRTGTFIAIDRLLFQIERDSLVDVYGVCHDLRMHRPLMVQTEDQYVFLNQCALDIIRSRTGTNVDLIYQNTAALSIYENFEPMKPKNGYNA